MPICPSCGTHNHASLDTCMYCGKTLKINKQTVETFSSIKRDRNSSDLNGIVLLLLFIFLPTAHDVYVNKIGLAFLFFLTGGGFGIWWFIDLVRVISGNFPDQNGKPIRF
jgi:hypothetical protein